MLSLKLLIRIIKVKFHVYKNRQYWKNYYKKHRDNDIPSTFATFCLDNYIKNSIHLLELGCGNGRDSFFFARNGIDVTALDLESDEIKYLRKKNNYKNLNFLNRNFTTYTDINQYDVIYSRFSIHAITENDEDETLKNSYKNLKNNGLLLIEVRSIKDQMFIDSQCLSDNEGVTDHYRRFIDFSKLKQKLEGLNFKIIYSIESTGLAIHGNEDPSIIRFVAQKKDYKL